MRKAFFVLTAVLCVSVIAVLAVDAADVTLGLTNNSEQEILGYRIYYSTRSGDAPYKGADIDQGRSPIDISIDGLDDPNHLEIKLTGLSDKTYRFAATAYDEYGNESVYSNEVRHIVDQRSPGDPHGLEVDYNPETKMLSFSWGQAGDVPVDFWKIFYRDAGQADWVELDQVEYSETPSLTVGLTAVAVGEHKTVEFTVVAFRDNGKHSEDSAVVSVEIDRKPPLPPELKIEVNASVE